MIELIKQYWQLAVIVAALLIGFAGGWYIQGNRWAADVATIKAANSANMQQIANTAQAATADALAKQQAAEKSAAAIDAKYTQDLTNAQSEISTLRSAVAAGSVELRLNATCEGNSSGGNAVSKTGSAGSVTNETSPRLNDTAQSNYYTLVERIKIATAQITGLQDYIKSVCLAGVTQ